MDEEIKKANITWTTAKEQPRKEPLGAAL